jgi:hypothetical protein
MTANGDEFLREEILGVLYDAEEQRLRYPSTAIQNVGRCLELACRYRLKLPAEDRTALIDLLNQDQMKSVLGDSLEHAHLLREARNEALHGLEAFDSDQAQNAIWVLKTILQWLGMDPESAGNLSLSNPDEGALAVHCGSRSRMTPDWETINAWTGQQSLTEGERYLVEMFDESLGDDWQIFVQPYFLGLRPDLVLLNPKQQVIHIEVKDWQLDGFYWNAQGQLRDGRFGGRDQIRENPILQANLVRRRFLEGPLADLNERGKAPKIIRSILYFHLGTKERTKEVFEKRANDLSIKLLHREDVDREGANAFTTASRKQFGGPSSEQVLRSLEPYLGIPEYVADQLAAQPSQRRLCLTKWERPNPQAGLFDNAPERAPEFQDFERVRGGAGAGKSHILALRAARAAKLGKRVLITSLHITMANYLYGLVRRAAVVPQQRERILVRHFHGFLYDQQVEAGVAPEPGEAHHTSVTEVVDSLFAEGRTAKTYLPAQFDAIYIDEGQDFDAEQIKALRRFLSPDGELVLFADGRQDVHGKFRLWKRLPVPFKGWRQLNGSSQRLPDFVARWLNFVAEESSVGDASDSPLMPKGELLPSMDQVQRVPLWWADFESEVEAVEAVPFAIRLILEQFPSAHPSDIVVLTHRRDVGLRIVGCFVRDFGQNSVKHVFGDNLAREQFGKDDHIVRKQKVAFHQADGRFKACTIHSFKGWEAEHVVLLWTPISAKGEEERARVASLFYTGASRCRKSMIILNVSPEYVQLRDGSWNDFMEAIGSESQDKWRERVSLAKPIRSQRINVNDSDMFAE